jgi:hypothetical protein
MCATLTLNLSRSAGKALIHSGSFGWFNQVGPNWGYTRGQMCVRRDEICVGNEPTKCCLERDSDSIWFLMANAT